MTNIKFSDLGLLEPIQRVLQAEKYETPTPIQAKAIPVLLDKKDLLGIAQTGTGKTAAFALPILQSITKAHGPREPKTAKALILAPTRELANQIATSFKTYGRHLAIKMVAIYGGVSQRPQVEALAKGVDVLIATPGRLLDLINQRHLRLDKVSILVLDEADQMLDIGFLPPIRKVVAMLPKQRQSIFFSATMPDNVRKLAAEILTNPVRVEITPAATPVERIQQSVYMVSNANKKALLEKLLEDGNLYSVIVFTKMKHSAGRLADQLIKQGITADAIHGNKGQGARQRALKAFKEGKVRVLVATDVAARGIDIDGITHVINYDLPMTPDVYIHRIGRTARAGAKGDAISFCDPSERNLLRSIERLMKKQLPVIKDHAFVDTSQAARSAEGDRDDNRSRNRRPSHHKKKFGRSDNRSSGNRHEGRRRDEDSSGNRHENRRRDDHQSSGRHENRRRDENSHNRGDDRRRDAGPSNKRGDNRRRDDNRSGHGESRPNNFNRNKKRGFKKRER